MSLQLHVLCTSSGWGVTEEEKEEEEEEGGGEAQKIRYVVVLKSSVLDS